MSEKVPKSLKESYQEGDIITVKMDDDPKPWDAYVTGYSYYKAPEGMEYKHGDGPVVKVSTNPPHIDKLPYDVVERNKSRAAAVRPENIIG